MKKFDVHSWAVTGNNFIAPASLPAARRLFVFRHSSLTSHDIHIHSNTYDANEIAAPAAQELFTVDAGYASNIIWQETYDRFRRWSNTGTVARCFARYAAYRRGITTMKGMPKYHLNRENGLQGIYGSLICKALIIAGLQRGGMK